MNASDRSVAATPSRALIDSLRAPKAAIDPRRPLGVMQEWEPISRAANGTSGGLADVRTVFLAGAECAFRCTMCDLWRNTLDEPTARGALPAQLRQGLAESAQRAASRVTSDAEEIATSISETGVCQAQQWIKLYNSSNFFDPRCVPREDWDAIADCVAGFSRVVVENHPRFVDRRVAEFAARLNASLEVAMGLETVNEHSLRLLNKQMTLADFERAAALLQHSGVELRVFVLLQPPGTAAQQALHWVMESLRFAQRCGARHCSVIPTRGGNGMMEALAAKRLFSPPTAGCLEAALAAALQLPWPMLVTADLWDWDRLDGHCDRCRQPRRRRLLEMNLRQSSCPAVALDCGCR